MPKISAAGEKCFFPSYHFFWLDHLVFRKREVFPLRGAMLVNLCARPVSNKPSKNSNVVNFYTVIDKSVKISTAGKKINTIDDELN